MRNATTHQPPFTSSTPIFTVKRRQTTVTTSENNGIRHKIRSNVKVASAKKMGKVNSKNDGRCGKMRKLSAVQNTKLSGEKTPAEIVPDTVGSYKFWNLESFRS